MGAQDTVYVCNSDKTLAKPPRGAPRATEYVHTQANWLGISEYVGTPRGEVSRVHIRVRMPWYSPFQPHLWVKTASSLHVVEDL